jgi:hypothetical protein
MLKHLIRVICVPGNLGLAFRGYGEFETSVNRTNIIEILKLFANYDADLESLIENKGVFRGLSPRIRERHYCLSFRVHY